MHCEKHTQLSSVKQFKYTNMCLLDQDRAKFTWLFFNRNDENP